MMNFIFIGQCLGDVKALLLHGKNYEIEG